MLLILFAAIAASALTLLLLCIGDPKRRRAAEASGEGLTRLQRRALAAGASLPGLLLALNGDAAAFLIWLGAAALAGWCMAAWLGGNRGSRVRRHRRDGVE